ncbi:hypothetical protein E4T56_gene4329, partial [Termitomyces sp. T112]
MSTAKRLWRNIVVFERVHARLLSPEQLFGPRARTTISNTLTAETTTTTTCDVLMAASTDSSPASSSTKVSRFSTTLKAFKFSPSKPPPPPPKDGIYRNPQSSRSFVSMSRSAASLLSDVHSSRSIPPQPHKKRPFFRFGKKSASSPTEDDGISLPWNFSHNIHVDEGFTGMPPTWTASLTNAGFTEEEIMEIQTRRQATRSPGLQYLYNTRPASPAYSTTDRVLVHPLPRSSSLHRPSAESPARPSTPPRWPFYVTNEPPAASPPPSYVSGVPPDKRPPPPASTSTLRQPIAITPPSPTLSSSTSTSTSITSPPLTLSTSSPTSPALVSPTTSDTDTLRKRLTALPPRLSLHKSKDSTDLLAWGEALLSGISTAGAPGGVFESAQELGLGAGTETMEVITNRDYYKRVEERRASELALKQQGKGAMPLIVDVDTDTGEGPSSSVVEPAVTARYDPDAMSWDEGQEDVPRSSPLWDDIEGLLRPENARSSGRSLDVQGEAKRESSRSSTSTVIAEPATIGVARSVSVVRKVGRYVVGRSPVVERREEAESEEEEGEVRRALPSPLRPLPRSRSQPASPHPPRPTRPAPSPPPPQPLASSSSSPTSTSGSTTSGNENSTPLTDEGDVERGLDSYYWDGGTTVDEGQKQSEPSTRPRIVVSDDIPSSLPVSYPPPNSATSFATTTTTTPLSPLHRYRGWLSSVVEPLERYIDDTIDPREFYLDLQEIAEGDSG